MGELYQLFKQKPLAIGYIAVSILNMAMEIVSFPINGMVDLSIVLCKRLPGDPEGKSVSNEPQTEHHPIASSMKQLDEAAKGAKNLSP